MTILKRQFSRHERGVGDEDWYYLARDTSDGHVFVCHEWSHRKGDSYVSDSADIELDAFMRQPGTVSDRLLVLIGTLVEDDTHAQGT